VRTRKVPGSRWRVAGEVEAAHTRKVRLGESNGWHQEAEAQRGNHRRRREWHTVPQSRQQMKALPIARQ
jgi:hypothetical protein